MNAPSRTDFRVLKRVLVAGLLAGCCMVSFSIITQPPHLSRKGALSKDLINARQLASACKLYAAEHQDRFPASLESLEPHYVPRVELAELRRVYAGQRPEIPMDWLYFGTGFNTKNPPRLLLASPLAVTIGGSPKRVVFDRDAEGRVVEEDEYEQLLSETMAQIKSLAPPHPPVQSATTGAQP